MMRSQKGEHGRRNVGETIRKTDQPQEAQFTRTQLRRMLGISERQLSAWERQGWLQARALFPDGPTHGAKDSEKHTGRKPVDLPLYTFSDIVTLKTLLRLRQNGVPASRLRLVQVALRDRLAKAGAAGPWSELQIHNQGKHISVYFQGTRMEPLTGQLLLDYNARERAISREYNVRPIERLRAHRSVSEADRQARANRLFLAGLRYEENPATISKAIRAYQRATQVNPRAIGAFINLGTIYYHQGSLNEAEGCYRAAIALNPRYALVHFNLGNLFEEKGEWEKAREHYEEAIRLDPDYSDPRYNLALVYERLGQHGKAWQQWRGYLKLDSQGPWADYARQKLEQLPLRVLPARKPPQDDQ